MLTAAGHFPLTMTDLFTLVSQSIKPDKKAAV